MPDLREEQTARAIIHQVARDRGFTVADLTGRDLARDVVEARQDAMAAVYRQTDLSSTQVGALFGDRDHSTVLNSIRRSEQRAIGLPAALARVTVVSKRCSRCGEVKAATEFYRHNRPTGDGLQGYCRPCGTEAKRRKHGTRARRRHGADTRQTSMMMDRQLYDALLATAAEFGVTRSQLIEDAVRRELRRLWTTCRRCGQGRRLDGADVCGPCLATSARSAVAS